MLVLALTLNLELDQSTIFREMVVILHFCFVDPKLLAETNHTGAKMTPSNENNGTTGIYSLLH